MGKWVLSEQRLKLSKEDFTAFLKTKQGKVKEATIKRYWRDWHRYHRTRKPVKPAKMIKRAPRRVKKVFSHYVHLYLFRCRTTIFSSMTGVTEHYFAYKSFRKRPSDDIVMRLHRRAYPDHQVQSVRYHDTSPIFVEAKLKDEA